MKSNIRPLAFSWTLFIIALGLYCPSAYAQIPGIINFQGKLLDTSNNPKNGAFSMTFSIYNVPTGGSSLWTETQPSVPVTNGVFSVQLGAVTAISQSVFVSSPTYLEVDIAGQTGSPRQELVTSPYAFSSGQADTATIALTAENLVPGNNNYIQNAQSLQSGAVFYISSATIGGPFVATGTVTLGSSDGSVSLSSNTTITGNLTVSGAGPQVLGGNVQIKGNNLLDSAGINRITLGATNVINGSLGASSGAQLIISTNIVVVGQNNNSDHYIAFPMTAGGVITARAVLTITGANSVTETTAANPNSGVLTAAGISLNAASTGQTVYVAVLGIVTGVVVDGAANIGDQICPSTLTAGRATDCWIGSPNGGAGGGNMMVGQALTGATKAGQTITVLVMPSDF